MVFGLSTKNEPLLLQVVHTGSINASSVHSREAMQSLILENCECCVVAHKSPSNEATPSLKDIDVIQRLVEVGKLLGIDVMDHLILACNSFRYPKESCLEVKEMNSLKGTQLISRNHDGKVRCWCFSKRSRL